MFILDAVMGLLKTSKNALVRKCCIEVIPAIYKSIKSFQEDPDKTDNAIREILEFIRLPNNKDRGTGFISLGELARMKTPPKNFDKYIDNILTLISEEVKMPPKEKGLIKLQADLDSLTCMKYLLRSFGPLLKNKIDMYALINDIFYTGYNR